MKGFYDILKKFNEILKIASSLPPGELDKFMAYTDSIPVIEKGNNTRTDEARPRERHNYSSQNKKIGVLYGIEKNLSNIEIAEILGTSPLHVSQIKTYLRKDNMVSGKGKNTELTDAARKQLEENKHVLEEVSSHIKEYTELNERDIGVLYATKRYFTTSEISDILNIQRWDISKIRGRLRKKKLISGEKSGIRPEKAGLDILEENKDKYAELFRKIDSYRIGKTAELHEEVKKQEPPKESDSRIEKIENPPGKADIKIKTVVPKKTSVKLKEYDSINPSPAKIEPAIIAEKIIMGEKIISAVEKQKFNYLLEDRNIRITNGKEYINLLLLGESEEMDKKRRVAVPSNFDLEFTTLEIIKNAEVKKEELRNYIHTYLKKDWPKRRALGVLKQERNLVIQDNNKLKTSDTCNKMLEQTEISFFGKPLKALGDYGLPETVFFHDSVGKIRVPSATEILDRIKYYERNAERYAKPYYTNFDKPPKFIPNSGLKIFSDNRVEIQIGDERKVLVTGRNLTNIGNRYLSALNEIEKIDLNTEREFLKYGLLDDSNNSKNVTQKGIEVKGILEKFAMQQTTAKT